MYDRYLRLPRNYGAICIKTFKFQHEMYERLLFIDARSMLTKLPSTSLFETRPCKYGSDCTWKVKKKQMKHVNADLHLPLHRRSFPCSLQIFFMNGKFMFP